MLVGYARLALRPAGNFTELEGWVKGFYPIGLILLLVSGWIATVLGLSGGFLPATWQPPVAAVILAGVLGLVFWRVNKMEVLPFSPTVSKVVKTGWVWVIEFLQFKWFFELLWALYRGLKSLVAFLTLLFEGEGGLLWSFLLLALMLTILATKAGP